MDRQHYKEMESNLDSLLQTNSLQGRAIYLFGHCNATEALADLLADRGFQAAAILDNNLMKHGKEYNGIAICPPRQILRESPEKTAICIAARAYASMVLQLRQLGYTGPIYKLVEYNSYSEYSLSEETISRKRIRVEDGMKSLRKLQDQYPGFFRILCPFSALGDIYFVMSYLPHFMKKRNIDKCLIGVIGEPCGAVARLFGDYLVEVLPQREMDETIQAALYTNDPDTFIAHQDRPYVVNLHKALYVKMIPLEKIYCCGVFGLPPSTEPCRPTRLREYRGPGEINRGKAVILSPYAKSITALKPAIWTQIVEHYLQTGYQCFTNVAGDEEALPGTTAISPAISEIQSAAEQAGIFIGIRSGLCDVLKYADCKKIALYPDYYYCDTRWKAIDLYRLDGWENIVVKEGFEWKTD